MALSSALGHHSAVASELFRTVPAYSWPGFIVLRERSFALPPKPGELAHKLLEEFVWQTQTLKWFDRYSRGTREVWDALGEVVGCPTG